MSPAPNLANPQPGLVGPTSSCWTMRPHAAHTVSIDRTSYPVLCSCAGQFAASKGVCDEPPGADRRRPAGTSRGGFYSGVPTVVCAACRQVAGSNVGRGTRVVRLMAAA